MTEQTKLLASTKLGIKSGFKPVINPEGDRLLNAIQFAYENDIWPSSRNLAILLGNKHPKLDGKMNARRRAILRMKFYF